MLRRLLYFLDRILRLAPNDKANLATCDHAEALSLLLSKQLLWVFFKHFSFVLKLGLSGYQERKQVQGFIEVHLALLDPPCTKCVRRC